MLDVCRIATILSLDIFLPAAVFVINVGLALSISNWFVFVDYLRIPSLEHCAFELFVRSNACPTRAQSSQKWLKRETLIGWFQPNAIDIFPQSTLPLFNLSTASRHCFKQYSTRCDVPLVEITLDLNGVFQQGHVHMARPKKRNGHLKAFCWDPVLQ